MTKTEHLFLEAKKSVLSENFQQAINFLDAIIQLNENMPIVLAARYMRGQIYENGYLGELNFEMAVDDYEYLAKHEDLIGLVGVLALARTLMFIDSKKNLSRINDLCESVIKAGNSDGVHAMMILGRTNELNGNMKLASKFYLMAYKNGLPWGMRYYARMNGRLGNFFRCVSAHIWATLIGPLCFIRYGTRREFESPEIGQVQGHPPFRHSLIQ